MKISTGDKNNTIIVQRPSELSDCVVSTIVVDMSILKGHSVWSFQFFPKSWDFYTSCSWSLWLQLLVHNIIFLSSSVRNNSLTWLQFVYKFVYASIVVDLSILKDTLCDLSKHFFFLQKVKIFFTSCSWSLWLLSVDAQHFFSILSSVRNNSLTLLLFL